jgi:hypothetical protein
MQEPLLMVMQDGIVPLLTVVLGCGTGLHRLLVLHVGISSLGLTKTSMAYPLRFSPLLLQFLLDSLSSTSQCVI